MRALTRNMISIFIGLIMIYNSLVEPYFEYCSNVLDSLGNGLSAKLQKLQNTAARIITSSDYNVKSVKLLKQLNWKTLSEAHL